MQPLSNLLTNQITTLWFVSNIRITPDLNTSLVLVFLNRKEIKACYIYALHTHTGLFKNICTVCSYTCIWFISASCAYCSFNAQCVYNSDRFFYQCVCDKGYTGDGRSCQLIEDPLPRDATTESTSVTGELRWAIIS